MRRLICAFVVCNDINRFSHDVTQLNYEHNSDFVRPHEILSGLVGSSGDFGEY